MDPSRTEQARAERIREDLSALRRDRDAGSAAPARTRRWIAPALVIGVLLVGYALYRALAGSVTVVQIVPAQALEARGAAALPVLSGSGYLVPAQEKIAIGARVAGRIERYLVEEGQRVRRGDPLVKIEDRPYRTTVEERTAALASVRAQLAFAESELLRARRLYQAQVLARDQYERRDSEARVARAQVLQHEASLERAKVDLEDTVVRAPTDGIVLEKTKRPGEVAVPGGFSGSGDLLSLADLSELRAELDVNEADLTQIRLGQRAEVTPDAFPEARYVARVVELAPQINREKGTRKVEVRVLEPDERLLPDMSARVTFLAEAPATERGGVLIPAAALRREAAGDGAFVWTIERDHARKRRVEVGMIAGDRVLIRSGLRAGDPVVTGTPPGRDGERVKVAREGSAD